MLDLYKYSDSELSKLLKTIEIIVDSREQENQIILNWLSKHKIAYRIEKLDFGDYSFCLPKNEEFKIPNDLYFNNKIAIERKGSLDELAINFTKDRTRLEEEFSSYTGKMTLLIENSQYNDIMEHKYRSQYTPKAFIATLHTFSERYGFNYLFLPNNEYSGQFIAYTFYYYLRNYIKK